MKKRILVFALLIMILSCAACKSNESLSNNTQTTVYIGEDKYVFTGENSVTLTTVLNELNYGDEVCYCAPEYYVDTKFGKDYGINLTEAYVKYDGKQVGLSTEQYDTIEKIINWVKTQQAEPRVKITAGDNFSSFKGVSVKTTKLKFAHDESLLAVKWENKTDYTVVYDDSYLIERFENGKWVSCQIEEDIFFNDLETALTPKSVYKDEYGFYYDFDLSAIGKYRFVADCVVYKDGQGSEGEKCNLWAEFTLS